MFSQASVRDARFSKILTLFQTKKSYFPHPFSELHGIGRNWVIIFRLELKQKDFLKTVSKSLISLSFWFIWNWSDNYVHTPPKFPRIPYPIPHQNGQNHSPFSDRNGPKSYALGWHIPICPPPPTTTILRCLLSFVVYNKQTRRRVFVLVDFIGCLPPEKPCNTNCIPSVL